MNGNITNSDFKMKTAEFRGYTIKALEDIDKDTYEIKERCHELDKKLDKLNDKMTNISIKVGIMSGTISFTIGLIISLVFNIIS